MKKSSLTHAFGYIFCGVALLIPLAIQAFAEENSAYIGDKIVRLYLERENEKYPIKNVAGYEDAFIERVGDKVYLVRAKTKIFLDTLGLAEDEEYRKRSPDVLIYSATFDSKMHFLIKKLEGASNASYGIVDENGVDVSLLLFDKKVIEEMRETEPQESGNGFLLPNPSFDDDKKTLTLFNNSGQASYVVVCTYKKGRYHLLP